MNRDVFISLFPAMFQPSLIPELEDGSIDSGRYELFLTTLEMLDLESMDINRRSDTGRPPKDSVAIARAFVAKATWGMKTTRELLDRLKFDKSLRRMCGWVFPHEIPSEATFSRAFAEFAATEMPARVHEKLVREVYDGRLVGHVARDATAIEGRERSGKSRKASLPGRQAKQGPSKMLAELPQECNVARKKNAKGSLLDRQPKQRLSEMLADLPRECDVACKKNAKGHGMSWRGYKLHVDVADSGLPLSCLLTSASVHDSQVAIPLSSLTGERVEHLYELMDSAYDAKAIRNFCAAAGRKAIIAINPRRDKAKKERMALEAKARRHAFFTSPSALRYRLRGGVERTYGRLKDEFGGRSVYVRGPAKVFAHLMFGILALSCDQLGRIRQQR